MRRPSAVLAPAALALALAACVGPADGESPSTGPGSSTVAEEDPATPETMGPEPAGAEITVDGVVVRVTGTDPDAVQVEHGSSGTVTLTVEVTAAQPATLHLEAGGTMQPNLDASVTVLDATGAAVAGLSPPTSGAQTLGAGPTSVLVRAPSSWEEGVGLTTSLTLGAHGVAEAAWGDRDGGRSLVVEPTRWARDAGLAGIDVVWAQLVAQDPGADVPGMRDQLVCHGVGARDKATWNLEPWRPDVGLVAVLAARCNPVAD